MASKGLSRASTPDIRLGGPVFGNFDDPTAWVQAVKNLGYTAAYCPVDENAADHMVKAFKEAAEKANIIIAEVGVWNNPLNPDEDEAKKAFEKNVKKLYLADRIGARCCVNISGSRGRQWDGPDEKNLTEETFDMIVEITRRIIDAVKPAHTFFTLETMPWAYPDSTESYLRLLRAIDRPRFAVHLDPVNTVNCPERYYRTGQLIRESFKKLGPHIKSCHAKDISLSPKLTTHLDEVRIGQGNLDYRIYLGELAKLDDVPLMLEHLNSPEDYKLAGDQVRKVAGSLGLSI